MSQGYSLKSYLNFFQNQLTKVPNCGEKIVALAFISGLQIAQPFYKHLLKHNIAELSELLSQAYPYIQLEETMKASSNHSGKLRVDVGKLKIPCEAPDYTPDRHRGQPAYKK